MKSCAKALTVVDERLERTNFMGKYVVRKLGKSLRMIEEFQKLFSFASHADQQ